MQIDHASVLFFIVNGLTRTDAEMHGFSGDREGRGVASVANGSQQERKYVVCVGQDDRRRKSMSFFPTGPRDRAERERQRLRQAEEYRHRARVHDDDQIPEDEEIDEIDEDGIDENPADELLATFRKIDRLREELHAAGNYFAAILQAEPALRQQWDTFLRAGGIGSRDFRRYLDGYVIRYRPMRRRKHLRLVINQRNPTVTRPPRGHGDAA
jgi:hypothetical protein